MTRQSQPTGQPGVYAAQPAAAVSKPAAASTKAVISMILGISSFCLAAFAGIPAVLLGILALNDIHKSQGQMGGKGLAIAGISMGGFGALFVTAIMICIAPALLLPAVQRARDVARENRAEQDLDRIRHALSFYQRVNHEFPETRYSKPEFPTPHHERIAAAHDGLSWRVRILPGLGYEELYSKFKLHEPWDSPHNRELLKEMPKEFRSSGVPSNSYKTTYLAVQPGPGAPEGFETFLKRSAGRRETDISEVDFHGMIILVEADPEYAVEWTRPKDYEFEWNNPRAGLNRHFDGFVALFLDGEIRTVSDLRSDEEVRNMFGAKDEALVMP